MYINKYASLPGASAGTRSFELCEEFQQQGHEVSLINSVANHLDRVERRGHRKQIGSFLHAEVGRVEVWSHRSISYKKTASLRRILSWVHFELGLLSLPRRFGAAPTHLIVSSPSILTLLTGLYLSQRYSAHLVVEIRDVWPVGIISGRGSWLLRQLVRPLEGIERVAYKSADLIVGTMPNLGERVKQLIGGEARVVCIGLGVGREIEHLLSLRPTGSGTGKFVVGYAGSFGASNRVEMLLEAAESVVKVEGLEFRFFGHGDRYDLIRGRHNKLQNVTFCGFLPRPALHKELAACDVMVFATGPGTEWRYGQSLNKVVEAMVLAKPLLGIYSGFPSMVNEAECGFLVPGDSLDEFVSVLLSMKNMPRQDLREMGKRGQRWIAENRSYRALAGRYIEELDRLAV